MNTTRSVLKIDNTLQQSKEFHMHTYTALLILTYNDSRKKKRTHQHIIFPISPAMMQLRSPVPREERNLTESAMAPMAVRK